MPKQAAKLPVGMTACHVLNFSGVEAVGSFGLSFAALQRGGAARLSSFLFLAPIFATLLSVLVLPTTLIEASLWHEFRYRQCQLSKFDRFG